MTQSVVRLAYLITVGLSLTSVAVAQQSPSIGYIYPSGGQAGTTVEARIGGYDWTPDMQVYCLDPRVTLEVTGVPGEVIVPEPPYWFGKKARGSALPLPREVPVKLTLPADLPAGPIYWQAANANGATARGVFHVSHLPEVTEESRHSADGVQALDSLPVIVSGQIQKIEEVDRYRIQAPKSGPLTCRIATRSLKSALRPILEVRDDAGHLIAEGADTEHHDLVVTFPAEAQKSYSLALYDLDFRGDRSLTYRLELSQAPRIVAALPAVLQRGQARSITLWGYGIASGTYQLESLTRNITAPDNLNADNWTGTIETAVGPALITCPLVNQISSVEPETSEPAARVIETGMSVTGQLLERYADDRYLFQGDPAQPVWISAKDIGFGAHLDLSLAVLNEKGESVGSNDDLPGTTDAGLLLTPPVKGPYQIVVSDASGHSGQISAAYCLTVATQHPDFSLTVPEKAVIKVGTSQKLAVSVSRSGGFNGPIALQLNGTSAGVSTAGDLVIPEGANELSIELTAADSAPAVATLVSVTGAAKIGESMVTRTAGPLLLATTMTPPFTVDAGGKDDVTKWPRGTTFPAPVLIERHPGFDREIRLEMAALNDRHRQGIRGPEMIVPPGVTQVVYPVTVPEWLETTRTSRIILNGVAKVPDGSGVERYLVSRLQTRIGFLPGGALLKVAHQSDELKVRRGDPFEISVRISRSAQLTGSVTLQLKLPEELQTQLSFEPVELMGDQLEAVLKVIPSSDCSLSGRVPLTIQSLAMKDGTLPVLSETVCEVEFLAAEPVARTPARIK